MWVEVRGGAGKKRGGKMESRGGREQQRRGECRCAKGRGREEAGRREGMPKGDISALAVAVRRAVPASPAEQPAQKAGSVRASPSARGGGRGAALALPGAAVVRGRRPAPGMEGHVEGLSKILRNL